MFPAEIVRNFGEVDAVGQPVTDHDGVEVAKAWYQHHIVRVVRQKLDSFATKDAEFVALLGSGTTLETFQRKMRGEATISYDDMLRWAVLLGSGVLPQLSDDDLFPPAHRDWLDDWTPASLEHPRFRAPTLRVFGEVDWGQAATWTLQRAQWRSRRGRGHLADDSVLRDDLLSYLLADRSPVDGVHLEQVGPTPGIVFAPPRIAALGCVWVPDLPTSDQAVTSSLCRLVILLHDLAQMSLEHRLAVLSIPPLPARTLARWYTGLGDVRRRKTFTFGQSQTNTLAGADDLSVLGTIEARDITVEVMTPKLNPDHKVRQLAVLRVVGHPVEAIALKLA